MFELVGLGFSQAKALKIMQIPASTWHYRFNPRLGVANPTPYHQRCGDKRISDEDRLRIQEFINAAWRVGNSVLEAYADALDKGIMLGSVRSWFRVANRMSQENRPFTRTRKTRAKRVAPTVVATRPNQAWSWDITDLPGSMVHTRYKLYQVSDLYSRKVVGWCVAPRESKTAAALLFDELMRVIGVPEVVHSDSGAAMRSREVREIVEGRYGARLSFSRPRTSNDNPYSEATFRTLKYRPDYPVYFESIEHARQWVSGFYEWYNNSHHHTSLALFTPSEVENGAWKQKWLARNETLQAYYQANPTRFNKPPTIPKPKTTTGINLHLKQLTTT